MSIGELQCLTAVSEKKRLTMIIGNRHNSLKHKRFLNLRWNAVWRLYSRFQFAIELAAALHCWVTHWATSQPQIVTNARAAGMRIVGVSSYERPCAWLIRKFSSKFGDLRRVVTVAIVIPEGDRAGIALSGHNARIGALPVECRYERFLVVDRRHRCDVAPSENARLPVPHPTSRMFSSFVPLKSRKSGARQRLHRPIYPSYPSAPSAMKFEKSSIPPR